MSARFLRGGLLLVAAGTAALAAPAAAQGYRASLDLRAQSVAFRGWELDSVPEGDVIVGPGGGPASPDGIAATCPGVGGQCYFYRPGERQESAPIVFTTDVTAWGFGLKGLSARANVRMIANAGDTPWPATQPGVQLWEGYLDYQHKWFGLRGGRQIITSRLGWTGFDGGMGTLRHQKLGLEATGYVGWGLSRSSPVGVNNPLNVPLGDFVPPLRHRVSGAILGLHSGPVDLRGEWQRETDRATGFLINERVAGSGTVRILRNLSATGGIEYLLAQDNFGSADASLRWASARVQATAGYRRYFPRFDLYSVWPAFSPVAWNGPVASINVLPLRWLQLRGRAEYLRFEETDTPSPLLLVRTDGWRGSVGGTVTAVRNFTFDAGWNVERIVGAWVQGFDGSVGWTPMPALALRAYGAYAQRPLEYRFNASTATWFGLDVDARATDRFNVGLSVVQINEERFRPDNAAFDWNQTRVSARATWYIASNEQDRGQLPKAIRRMPSSIGYQK